MFSQLIPYISADARVQHTKTLIKAVSLANACELDHCDALVLFH